MNDFLATVLVTSTQENLRACDTDWWTNLFCGQTENQFLFKISGGKWAFVSWVFVWSGVSSDIN